MPYPAAPVELIRQELSAPVLVNNLVLAGAAETATKPTTDPVSGEPVTITWLWIAATAACYMRFDGTATVPAADITDSTGSFPLAAGNGILLNVKNRASVSVIGTAVVGLAWYTDRSG
jgi:hypothetical protein